MFRRTVLPDLLEPGLELVICGMTVGAHSAEVGAYYALGSNKFWRVPKEIGLTPQRLGPGEFASLARLRLGLTELAKHGCGSDSVRGKRVLAFNGKNTAGRALERRFVEYGHRRHQPCRREDSHLVQGARVP